MEPQIGTPIHFTTMLRLNHTYTRTKTKLLTYNPRVFKL